jgi:amino acid adenylation domain-containing protein
METLRPLRAYTTLSEVPHLVDLLRWRAVQQPHQQGYTFLFSEENKEVCTYAELDRRARAVATRLERAGAVGERVLLLYPPGLAYIAAFFGCLYAGVVAVPAYPPRRNRPAPRLAAIAQSAQAKFVLTDGDTLAESERLLVHTPSLAALTWLDTENLSDEEAEAWIPPALTAESIAFLQYTSGSTSTPKGVILSHGNLLHNSKLIQGAFGTTTESRGVIWLPPYHDMGLIGGILQPLYTGFPVVLMPPIAFLQQPYFWLQTISRYQATASGGPNFAYELCIEKISPAQRETLDLSHWSVAFNGAEPVRHDTLKRFAETFAPCGFRYEAFYPCYGLAEGTLIAAGGNHAAPPITQSVLDKPLALNQVVPVGDEATDPRIFIGSGQTLPDQQLVIAHPDTSLPCAPNEVGEIWVSGPSIAQGYWGQREATEFTFNAHLADSGEGPFLRTGDLGFMQNGELFVTGRLKDLIIIRGRNVYPQDIEMTVEGSHPALRPGNGAAFAIEVDGEEQLVVVQEIQAHARHALNVEEVAAAVRQAVAEQHELQVYAVLLIRTGTIPKTSSGKIQRHACRAMWLEKSLSLVGESVLDASPSPELPDSPDSLDDTPLAYLQREVARLVRMLPHQIAPDQSLNRLGLDSLAAVELAQLVEARWGLAISMADLLDGITIAELVSAIDLTPPTPLSVTESGEQSGSATSLSPSGRGGQGGEVPLSAPQQRLWFLERLAPGNSAYHVAVAVEVKGRLDVEALRQSLNIIIERHESLRTTFHTKAGVPVQRILPPFALDLPILEATAQDEATWWAEVQRHATVDATRPFDLLRGPLIRATVVRHTPDHHVLLLTLHHLITDGWSMGVLAREVSTLYTALVDKQAVELPPLAFQYGDLAVWQQAQLEHPETVEPLRTYWQRQLAGMPPLLELPTDHPRPAVQTFNGAQVAFTIPPELRESLQSTATAQNATLFMTLLTALNLLFRAYTGREDMVIGTSVANRPRRESQPLIGFFVNQVVLRSNLAGTTTFREAVARVRQSTLDAFKHQALPFDKVVELLRVERNPAYNPLFQATFVFENAPLPDLSFAGLDLSILDLDSGTAPFDVSLLVSEANGGLKAIFRYNRDLFERETIEGWAADYQALLKEIVTETSPPYPPLHNGEGERPALLPLSIMERGLGCEVDFPQDKTIHQLFEEQAERISNSPAVVFQKRQLTFAELNAQANQLAHHLISLGVKAEMRVGLCITRSIEMMVGLLGILKAGAAYLPLDPTYPTARIGYLLEDGQPHVILTESRLQSLLPEHPATVVCMDAEWQRIERQPTTTPKVAIDPANMAYLLYTSGSTGTPKGVMVQHRSVINLATALHDAIYQKWNTGLRVSVNAPLVFDGSVKQWIQLLNGHTLCIVPDEVRADAPKLVRWIQEQSVDVLDCTPSLLKRLLAADLLKKSALTGVLVGGEAIDAPTWAQLAQSERTDFVNVYGPTEATVDATAAFARNIPNHPSIGHPIANICVYLLNEYLHPVEDGERGELFLGGAGVARGYWCNPALTAQRFLPDPFTTVPGARMYRTGDVARWRDDASGFDYIGRVDNQVQVQGVRIELGEITSVLNAHPAVESAFVTVRESALGEAHLVAYMVLAESGKQKAESGNTNFTTEIRADLRQRLPLYMMPRHIVLLEAFPLTPNGKIDVRALPAPHENHTVAAQTFVAPRNEIERKIASIWQEVLGIEKVGLHDNFWDLGGHSLLLVQAYDRLQEASGQEFSLVEMYRHPTISALSQYLSVKQPDTAPSPQVDERVRKQKEALERQRRLAGKRSGQG